MRILILTLILISPLAAQASDTLRVYLVGNSLTMSLRQGRLHRLFEERGIDYQFGCPD